MANTTRVTEGTGAAGGVAVAERVAAAHSLWLSALPTIRRAPIGDLLPQLLGSDELEPLTEPMAAPAVTVVDAITAAHGPISDLAVSPDGRHLVAAHYGEDVVSIIDTSTLSVTATVEGVSEPYAVAIADRAYVSSTSASYDSVMAIDTKTGAALAARPVAMTTGGLAVSPAGDVLYVGRTGDEIADIAAIDTESGEFEVIDISAARGSSVEALRISADGTRLFAALTTASGGALVVIDTKTGAAEHTVALGGSIGDITVHPSGRKVFATGWDAELGGVLHVIDTAAGRLTDTIAVGGLPTQLVLGHGGNTAYIVDHDEIVVVCTRTNDILESIAIDGQLSCLAASADGGRLYVADYAGGVTVLSLGAAADSQLLELMTAELPQLAAAAS